MRTSVAAWWLAWGFLGAVLSGCWGPQSPESRYCTTSADCIGGGACDTKLFVCVASQGEPKNLEASLLQEDPKEAVKEAEGPIGGDTILPERQPEDGSTDRDETNPERRPETPPEGTCTPGQTRLCYEAAQGCSLQADGSYRCQGECTHGRQACDRSGHWEACEGASGPKGSDNNCDGKDNDCDGKTDEDFPKTACTVPDPSIKGRCAKGEKICFGGKEICTPTRGPEPETCNGEDDDCNGQIDDNTAEAGSSCQTSNEGECKAGSQICEQGKLSCKQTFVVLAETCDGKDNDCDGIIDNERGTMELLKRPCEPAPKGCDDPTNPGVCRGVCKRGEETCKGGSWSACVGNVAPTPEICDGKDNNCDGQVDEDFPEQKAACNVAGKLGPCAESTFVCSNGQIKCPQVTHPAPETCDGKDNDCDGKIDNGCNCIDGETQPCYSGPPGTEHTPPCKKGTQTCTRGAWGACQGEGTPKLEACDSVDNDCDGKIDESFDGEGTPCSASGQKGECAKGKFVCKSGQKLCEGAAPVAEECNNKDDDCNGKIDEISRSCYTGPQGTLGIGECRSGTQVCANGVWGICFGENTPKTEVCNNKDDDCNGQSDETFTQKGQACTLGTGECLATGIFACKPDGSIRCNAVPKQPQEEICDNKDNDCDGYIDASVNGGQPSPFARPCIDNNKGCVENNGTPSCQGICKPGRQFCQNGQWGTCQGQTLPSLESCAFSTDEDCDGKINEICGPQVMMAVLGSNGTLHRNRGFTSLTKNNTFFQAGIDPNSGLCNPQNKPLVFASLLFGLTGSAQSVLPTGATSLYCDPNGMIKIVTRVLAANLLLGINVVSPANLSETDRGWAATASCATTPGAFCVLDPPLPPGTIVKRLSTGTIEVHSPLCNLEQPIFLQTLGSIPLHAAVSLSTQAVNICTFRFFDDNGNPGEPSTNAFAFWFPKKETFAWLIRDLTQGVKYNDFQKELPAAPLVNYDPSFQPPSSMVSHGSWAAPSALLITPRLTDIRTAAGATLLDDARFPRAFLYDRAAVSWRSSNLPFSLLLLP